MANNRQAYYLTYGPIIHVFTCQALFLPISTTSKVSDHFSDLPSRVAVLSVQDLSVYPYLHQDFSKTQVKTLASGGGQVQNSQLL